MKKHVVMNKNFQATESYDGIRVLIHEEEHLALGGRIMAALLEKWGMVAAMDDGEDSAGRQKLRLATPTEIVDRAEKITHLMLERAKSFDWIIKIPTLEEAEAALSAEDK